MSIKAQSWIVAAIIVLVLLIDQCLKFYVKLNFTLGESVPIFSWFHICFVENNGMAFGIEWFDKLFLTLFRIVAIGLFCWYIYSLLKRQQVRFSYIVFVALVTAGALGNIIDCLFYGLLFSDSTYLSVATFLPEGGGYAPAFYGRVVDMLYFPIVKNADGATLFFRPVFNLADSCITVAVFVIMLFYSKDLNRSLTKEKRTGEVQ